MEYIQGIKDALDMARNYENLDEKMGRLKRKVEKLESRENDVNDELTYAESLSLKKRRKSVETWLTDVKRVKEEVQQTEKEVRERKWYEFLKLQKSIERSTTEVEELIQEGGFPGGLTLEINNENHVFSLPTSELVGQMFQEDKNSILGWLANGTFSIIGVWGMGGVGKTTLVKHVYNELRNHPNTSVFWVTVSQNCSILKLQGDIAKAISLDLSNLDDELIRAGKLADDLTRRNNHVLILDDVWDNFPLEKVGIPIVGNTCKLIITTRTLELCRSMECQKEIKVKPLPDEEAWKLFTKTLGLDVELSLECEEIAKSLVKECDGLPLGIITMAGSMRGVEDIHEWRDALAKMRDSNLQHDDSELDKVFRVLRYSYDKLKDQIVQECFLCCSLFPEDYEIKRDELIEYMIDEGLIDKRSSRQMQLSRGHTILNKLVNVCLLEGGVTKYGTEYAHIGVCLYEYSGERYVKMHDLVRDMAIQIVSVTPRRDLVEAGVKLQNLPAEEKWTEDLVRISLMNNEISNIPPCVSPRSPRLLTLLLRQNFWLSTIPDPFFVHMERLAILDLSMTPITRLPSSISNLKSLIALLLRGCSSLKYVPSLATLKNLERIDFSWTKITKIPEGMKMLTKMRYLNLDVASPKIVMPKGILPQFPHLQHLVLLEFGKDGRRVSSDELASLTKLETFKGQLYNIGDFNKYVKSWEERGLNNYLLQVGDFPSEFQYRFDKTVRLKWDDISKSKAGEDSLFLPKDVQSLHIRFCKNVKSLCDVASLKKTTDSRTCKVEKCHEMEHLLCSSRCLPSASSVFQPGTFSYLEELSIQGCPSMKWLFMPALVSNLQNLQILEVRNCRQMVAIIGDASDEDGDEEATTTDILTFPKLSLLILDKLPKLKNFYYNNKAVASDAIETIEVDSCPKLKRIPLIKEDPCPPPSLQMIQSTKSWWESLEWDHPNTKNVLQPFVVFFRG